MNKIPKKWKPIQDQQSHQPDDPGVETEVVTPSESEEPEQGFFKPEELQCDLNSSRRRPDESPLTRVLRAILAARCR